MQLGDVFKGIAQTSGYEIPVLRPNKWVTQLVVDHMHSQHVDCSAEVFEFPSDLLGSVRDGERAALMIHEQILLGYARVPLTISNVSKVLLESDDTSGSKMSSNLPRMLQS